MLCCMCGAGASVVIGGYSMCAYHFKEFRRSFLIGISLSRQLEEFVPRSYYFTSEGIREANK